MYHTRKRRFLYSRKRNTKKAKRGGTHGTRHNSHFSFLASPLQIALWKYDSPSRVYGGEGTLNKRHTSLHISLLLVMHLPIELRQIVSSYSFFAKPMDNSTLKVNTKLYVNGQFSNDLILQYGRIS